MAMRASIIEHTAEAFDPDLFIVDKEPLGLRGEVEATLAMLRQRGTPCVLGLRDVMDEPGLLAPAWERKQVVPALQRYFADRKSVVEGQGESVRVDLGGAGHN